MLLRASLRLELGQPDAVDAPFLRGHGRGVLDVGLEVLCLVGRAVPVDGEEVDFALPRAFLEELGKPVEAPETAG